MKIHQPSLGAQSIAVFIGQASGFAINFLTPILLVRMISKSDYGVFQQFILMGNTMVPILGLGLASSLYYFFPISSGDQRRSFVFNTWIMMMISGLVFIGVFFAFGPNLLQAMGMDLLGPVGNLLSLYILFLLSGTLIDILFILEQRMKLSMGFNPLDKLVRMLLLVGAAFIENSAMSCMIGLLIYSLIRFLFIGYYVVSRYSAHFNTSEMAMNAKQHLAYSLPFAAGIIFTTISQRVDKLVVNRYVSTEEFAVYSLAFFSIPLITQAFTSINNVVMPQMSTYLDNGELNKAHTLFKQVVSKTSSIAFPSIVFFVAMAPEMIGFLFTEEYISAVPYYRTYLLTFLFTMTSFGLILRGFKKTGLIMFSNLVGMLASIVTAVMLIPWLKLTGAILTALVGLGIPILLQLYFEKKIFGVSLPQYLPWKDMFVSLGVAISCSASLPVIKWFGLRDDLSLALAAVLYFIPVLVMEIKLGIFAFDNHLKRLLKNRGTA